MRYTAEQQAILDEVNQEIYGTDNGKVLKSNGYSVSLVSFESRSNGRGRKPRSRSREIELVVVGGTGAVQVKEDGMQRRKNISNIRLDELAESVMGRGTSTEELLMELRERNNRAQGL